MHKKTEALAWRCISGPYSLGVCQPATHVWCPLSRYAANRGQNTIFPNMNTVASQFSKYPELAKTSQLAFAFPLEPLPKRPGRSALAMLSHLE